MTIREQPKPVVLTIAGFDPSGGAGIIADIRTIESFGCKAAAAITSVTFQNAEKFFGANHQSAESVRGQVEAITGAMKIAAVKIGMLPTPEIVGEVARLIREKNLPAPVVDPVMESTSGGKLMKDDAFEEFVTELLPLAGVVTPNIPEAEKLAGMNIRDEDEMRQAAARIRELGAPAVLIKGGHLGDEDTSSAPAIDILDDGGHVTVVRAERIFGGELHGSGCILASAIAAGLARGISLEGSVREAKKFVTAALIRTT